MHRWGMSLKLFQQSKKEGVYTHLNNFSDVKNHFLVIQWVSEMRGILPMDDVLFSVWSAISLHNLKMRVLSFLKQAWTPRVLSFESFNIYCLIWKHWWTCSGCTTKTKPWIVKSSTPSIGTNCGRGVKSNSWSFSEFLWEFHRSSDVSCSNLFTWTSWWCQHAEYAFCRRWLVDRGRSNLWLSLNQFFRVFHPGWLPFLSSPRR